MFKPRWHMLHVAYAVMLCVAASFAQVESQSPVDRFLAALASDADVSDDVRAFLQKSWSECEDCDAEEFLTQALATISVEFQGGLDAYDREDYVRCAGIMRGLSANPNPFLAMHAAAYEVKALVAAEQPIEALARIRELLADGGLSLAAHSYFAPEMSFLHGYCLLADLQYDEARTTLEAFLQTYPDASQRLTVAARQMLAELNNLQPGHIAEVADLMVYSARRLASGDSGDQVQTRQQKIIDILDKLIEEAEQQEQNSQNSGNSGSQGSQGQNNPSQPMQRSTLPQGEGQMGQLRPGRVANPAEVWGNMPPAERERILQALRESFPQRYRALVEQYYEELGKRE